MVRLVKGLEMTLVERGGRWGKVKMGSRRLSWNVLKSERSRNRAFFGDEGTW